MGRGAQGKGGEYRGALDEEELRIAHLQSGKAIVENGEEQHADRRVAEPAGAAAVGGRPRRNVGEFMSSCESGMRSKSVNPTALS